MSLLVLILLLWVFLFYMSLLSLTIFHVVLYFQLILSEFRLIFFIPSSLFFSLSLSLYLYLSYSTSLILCLALSHFVSFFIFFLSRSISHSPPHISKNDIFVVFAVLIEPSQVLCLFHTAYGSIICKTVCVVWCVRVYVYSAVLRTYRTPSNGQFHQLQQLNQPK